MTAQARNELNAFQQLMHYWSQLHPYNAVGAVRLRGFADFTRLRAVACQVFESLGIGRIQLDNDDRHFCIEPGEAHISVEAMDVCAVDGRDALSAVATSELNRGFANSSGIPIRLWVVPAGETFYFGWTFQHWIADGLTFLNWMSRIVSRYLGLANTDGAAFSDYDCPTYRRMFGSRLSFATLVGCALRTVRSQLAMRYCHCPYQGDRDDLRVEIRFSEFSPDTIPRLRHFARRRNVSVNNVILASLADAIAENTRDRLQYGHRRDLALCTILNLRQLATADLHTKAGLYLGYSVAICRHDQTRDFDRLVHHIRRQTAHIPYTWQGLQSIIEMQLASKLWPRVPLEARSRYFANRMPVIGGLSDLHAPVEWSSGAFAEYVSSFKFGVSTGPMSPLVVSAGRLGNRLSLGFTWRLTGFSNDRVQAIKSHLCRRLQTL
jgi:hypothetical protein